MMLRRGLPSLALTTARVHHAAHTTHLNLARLASSSSSSSLTFGKYSFLKELGLSAEGNHGVWDGEKWGGSGSEVTSYNPATGEPIATVRTASIDDYERCLKNIETAKKEWRSLPTPKRGDIIRQLGNEFRKKIKPLGQLISLEMGKIVPEGVGEVQEVVDVCDLALGMSRQLPGLWLPSERVDHVLLETWNPLGCMGVITAFNFPCAVMGWNAAIGLVCGNTQIWKGAPSTNLVSVATQKIFTDVLQKNGVNGAVATLCLGGADIGERMINDHRIPLISFTGSTEVGRRVSQAVHGRFGQALLELGGNNAISILDDADLEVALRSVLFAAVGTAGQRCTTARRLFIHEKIYDEFVSKLVKAYSQIKPGDPLVEGTLLGPLHNKNAVDIFENGVKEAQRQGGRVLVGGKRFERSGYYVQPTLIEIGKEAEIVKKELFVPISMFLK